MHKPSDITSVKSAETSRPQDAALAARERRLEQAERAAPANPPVSRVEPTQKTESAPSAKPRPTATPRYRVQLDPETMRVFTDILNGKGEVVMRIPPHYVESEQALLQRPDKMREPETES